MSFVWIIDVHVGYAYPEYGSDQLLGLYRWQKWGLQTLDDQQRSLVPDTTAVQPSLVANIYSTDNTILLNDQRGEVRDPAPVYYDVVTDNAAVLEQGARGVADVPSADHEPV